MGQITITQIKAPAIIGIHPWEKQHPQMLLIDLCINIDQPKADDLTQTIDYSAITDSVRDYCQHNAFNLIETLAQQLVTHLMAQYACNISQLTIHKPNALQHASDVSYTWLAN